MSEPTSLHDRIVDIIEAEWLRPFDPNDHAGDTPGARAYDAAHMELIPPESFAAAFIETARESLNGAENYVEYEINDRKNGERFAVRVQRVGKLTPHRAREAAEAERDGLLAVLSEVNRILAKWDRPYAPGHATNCVMAVHELQALLNPDHTPEEL